MKFLKAFVAAAAAFTALGAQAAHLSYSFTDGTPAGAYEAPSFTDGVNASVQNHSVANVYLRPEGLDDADSFLVVSKLEGASGSATVDLGDASSFSFVWGSPDTFNAIDIYSDGFGMVTYTGTQLGSQLFRSNGVAFELAVAAPVPEPETYAMMLAGLAAMGFVARRRRAD
jgi:hypothetical protein